MQGRWMPLEMTYHKNFGSAKQAFLMYHGLYILRAICILALVVLPFFEVIHVVFLVCDVLRV
jgi:two pore calcium channel protein